ncbi:glycyl-radical enzyme activating protein [Ructibacterium gallinarum]|uniref:Glycyl-radical enzyme activating protein n=1 Tax=Ructibacterium gallinarum TaxID=2779355 RepID=A0A9D5LZW7_9FIRM|nr:glycyl-radical enzyme activating protein [Ructibacterium gallinarum]MBE5039591.1 glycyl-radical enzyme activating protein [Ructibacterium gallinarum]
MNGTIFDIKEFSIHDGPGARITVFLKGCPLRCQWCHNPEGLLPTPQLMVKESLCTHCNRCFVSCKHEECKPFHRCAHACPNGCLSISGESISSFRLAERLNENAILLKSLNGGITFSGGEPLMQADFVCETADQLPALHKAIQTSGYADPKVYQKVVAKMDYVMQDIKLISEQGHLKYTGASNAKILKNIDWLLHSGKEYVFRIPLIPDITDTEENLTAISQLIGEASAELMPYNFLAGAKYQMLGMTFPLADHPNRKEDFTKFFQNAKLIS